MCTGKLKSSVWIDTAKGSLKGHEKIVMHESDHL